jgi:hypothetical protein
MSKLHSLMVARCDAVGKVELMEDPSLVQAREIKLELWRVEILQNDLQGPVFLPAMKKIEQCFRPPDDVIMRFEQLFVDGA